jgi:hypothetical protein
MLMLVLIHLEFRKCSRLGWKYLRFHNIPHLQATGLSEVGTASIDILFLSWVDLRQKIGVPWTVTYSQDVL